MLLACSLGAAAGVVFALLWLRVVPHSAHVRFWSAMQPLAQEVFLVESAAVLLRLYRRLATLTARYVARNFAGLLVAGLPAAVLLIFEKNQAVFIAAFAVCTSIGMLWPRRS
jgi:hypothetical protein